MDPRIKKNFIVPAKQQYICLHCGSRVLGGRYNNHCPHCLWSLHVDNKIPGDRASECKEQMEPIAAIQKKGVWRVTQRCTKCQHTFTVDTQPEDNIEVIISLTQR